MYLVFFSIHTARISQDEKARARRKNSLNAARRKNSLTETSGPSSWTIAAAIR